MMGMGYQHSECGNATSGSRLRDIMSGHAGMGAAALLVIAMSGIAMPSAAWAYAVADTPASYYDYFDANGIYTIVGEIRNKNDFAVLPTLTISVADGPDTITRTLNYVPVPANQNMPFKIKFPYIQTDSPRIYLTELLLDRTMHEPPMLEVLYDDTLIRHPDGHLTGKVRNTGDVPIYYPTIHAVVHGHDGVLDVVQNTNPIAEIAPGMTAGFSMHPDPAIAREVLYYSCFAPVDTTVIPVRADKGGGMFDFRYDSGAWFSAASFDESGTTLAMRGYNSYPLETYANFEFAPISGDEEFTVMLDGEPIEFIQSMDEMGFWHVAFPVEPTSQFRLQISGFEDGLPAQISPVPPWIKSSAEWWSAGRISDTEFLEGIEFLLDTELIMPQTRADAAAGQAIPPWVKIPSEWWSDDVISDDVYMAAMTFLIETGVISVSATQ